MDSDSSVGSPTPFVFEDARNPLLPSWQVACFAINVIMGSGFLGVPHGFMQAGMLLGMATLVGVTILMWLAACMLMQVISRAHALLTVKDAEATLTPVLVPFAKLGSHMEGGGTSRRPPALIVPSHTSYELMMLCRLHFGRWPERLAMLMLSLYQFGSLWSYISVFASSLAATVPLPWLHAGDPCDIYQTDTYGGGCITLYYWWALSFATLMAALLAFDVREQAAFQCCMTMARALVIAVMVFSLVFGERADFGLPPASPDVEVPWVRWGGMTTMIPVGVFCQNAQVGVPSLIQPLASKKDFPAIFAAALGCTFLMYSALGLTAVLRLGPDVDPSCNLNWRSWHDSSVGLAVSLFPALDCLSVFPMNAIFLSNNVMATIFQKRWHAGTIRRRTKYIVRLLCCSPPLVCAFAFPSLSKALDFTGIVGIGLPFIVIPLLALVSLRESHAMWGREAFDAMEARAGYSGACTSPLQVVGGVGLVGTVLLCFCLGCGLVYGF